mmetsp:Transcript_27775/g.70131  ORF Transcript_27775/g.70131 Transcript_27775/m.70131 type:complete len:243 (-) Transcript_27775:155-883(-)
MLLRHCFRSPAASFLPHERTLSALPSGTCSSSPLLPVLVSSNPPSSYFPPTAQTSLSRSAADSIFPPAARRCPSCASRSEPSVRSGASFPSACISSLGWPPPCAGAGSRAESPLPRSLPAFARTLLPSRASAAVAAAARSPRRAPSAVPRCPRPTGAPCPARQKFVRSSAPGPGLSAARTAVGSSIPPPVAVEAPRSSCARRAIPGPPAATGSSTASCGGGKPAANAAPRRWRPDRRRWRDP